jgi:membrane protease YdiL (CAAX protease family)
MADASHRLRRSARRYSSQRDEFHRLQPIRSIEQQCLFWVCIPVKSIIRSFSAPTEFLLVLFICFGLTIVHVSAWIIHNVWAGHAPASVETRPLENDAIIFLAVTEVATLGIALGFGRIRGWSITTFGFRLSWKWIGAGVLLFAAFFLIHEVIGFITREVFHSKVDYHRSNQLTLPVILLISLINPMFEETVESGYTFHALQRHGMWLTVLASAAFRAFLHATMGVSGVVTMFVQGLLYGFVYWRWRQLWPLIIAHALQMLYSLLRTMAW